MKLDSKFAEVARRLARFETDQLYGRVILEVTVEHGQVKRIRITEDETEEAAAGRHTAHLRR